MHDMHDERAMTDMAHATIADAIRGEMLRRYGSDLGSQARAAEDLGVDRAVVSRWLDPDKPGVIPQGPTLERLAEWLRMDSVYELGPYLVATRLKQAGRVKRLKKGRPE